jgi:Domain of unknown function (DUF4124)
MAWYKLLIGTVPLLLAASGALAQNEIYKCLDATGRPSYTNIKRDTAGRNCTMVTKEVSVVPAGPAQRASPAGFPRVDAATQRTRDDGRRRILENELTNEQQLLKDARTKLADQEQIRNGDDRNYQKVLDRLQPYKDTIDQHQKNVEALQKELVNLK